MFQHYTSYLRSTFQPPTQPDEITKLVVRSGIQIKGRLNQEEVIQLYSPDSTGTGINEWEQFYQKDVAQVFERTIYEEDIPLTLEEKSSEHGTINYPNFFTLFVIQHNFSLERRTITTTSRTRTGFFPVLNEFTPFQIKESIQIPYNQIYIDSSGQEKQLSELSYRKKLRQFQTFIQRVKNNTSLTTLFVIRRIGITWNSTIIRYLEQLFPSLNTQLFENSIHSSFLLFQNPFVEIKSTSLQNTFQRLLPSKDLLQDKYVYTDGRANSAQTLGLTTTYQYNHDNSPPSSLMNLIFHVSNDTLYRDQSIDQLYIYMNRQALNRIANTRSMGSLHPIFNYLDTSYPNEPDFGLGEGNINLFMTHHMNILPIGQRIQQFLDNFQTILSSQSIEQRQTGTISFTLPFIVEENERFNIQRPDIEFFRIVDEIQSLVENTYNIQNSFLDNGGRNTLRDFGLAVRFIYAYPLRTLILHLWKSIQKNQVRTPEQIQYNVTERLIQEIEIFIDVFIQTGRDIRLKYLSPS